MKPFDIDFLQACVLIASPLLMVALGELMSEVAGVLNVGLEGIMLVGAFSGFWAGSETGNVWFAVFVGLMSGVFMALIIGWATIEAKGNQIVVGVAINIMGAGISTFAFAQYSENLENLFIGRMMPLEIPLLSSIPVIGDAFFNQIPLVYVTMLMVPATWVLFYKTTWGLRMRAAGELPEAAETAGASVRGLRWQGVLIAGAMAGLAGAFLSVGMVGSFLGGLTAGRGYLALAAVIVGGWRPLGVTLAAFLFGAADALQLRLQAETAVPRSVWIVLVILLAVLVSSWISHHRTQLKREVTTQRRAVSAESGLVASLMAVALVLAFVQPDVSLPSQLWLAIPYALTIAALAGVIVRVRQPNALGVPFQRGGGV